MCNLLCQVTKKTLSGNGVLFRINLGKRLKVQESKMQQEEENCDYNKERKDTNSKNGGKLKS